VDDATQVAVGAARAAGGVLLQYFGRLGAVEHKGTVDLVTIADREAEAVIVAAIRRAYPTHRIVGEESGDHEGVGEHVWYVDPLDGTTNFVHAVPHFSVSIALLSRGVVVAGVVYDPMRQEMFHARRGDGSFLNGRLIGTSRVESLTGALVATGFPYDCHVSLGEHLPAFERVARRAQGLRRGGSAALDLSYVACGRFDGYWERGLKPWDTAAGTLLVREAGGAVTSFAGEHLPMLYHDVLATNGPIHGALRTVVIGGSP
jgi:myo-inositol-1(or 4)-monophosphatase